MTTTKAKTGTTKSTTLTTISVVFVALVVLFLGYSWWFSDERAVRHQLDAIAGALTVAPNESELGLVTRLATLRKALAPDVRISDGGQEVSSRDSVLALATRWRGAPGGIVVEFDDVGVKIGDGRLTADVYCTAKMTTTDVRGGPPTIDAREVTARFKKLDGVWVVDSAQTERTLTR